MEQKRADSYAESIDYWNDLEFLRTKIRAKCQELGIVISKDIDSKISELSDREDDIPKISFDFVEDGKMNEIPLAMHIEKIETIVTIRIYDYDNLKAKINIFSIISVNEFEQSDIHLDTTYTYKDWTQHSWEKVSSSKIYC